MFVRNTLNISIVFFKSKLARKSVKYSISKMAAQRANSRPRTLFHWDARQAEIESKRAVEFLAGLNTESTDPPQLQMQPQAVKEVKYL